MKLRNKKTGRIVNFRHIAFDEPKDDRENYSYSSLAQFNEEWEDYKPAEPLIKDEKIRKVVRVWASKNIIEKAKFEYIAGTGSIFKDEIGGVEIGFYGDLKLTNRETYTIDELCGRKNESR